MNEKYPWAVNSVKLNRAVAKLSAEAKEISVSSGKEYIEPTEDAIKAEYIKLAGALYPASAKTKSADDVEVSTPAPRARAPRA